MDAETGLLREAGRALLRGRLGSLLPLLREKTQRALLRVQSTNSPKRACLGARRLGLLGCGAFSDPARALGSVLGRRKGDRTLCKLFQAWECCTSYEVCPLGSRVWPQLGPMIFIVISCWSLHRDV